MSGRPLLAANSSSSGDPTSSSSVSPNQSSRNPSTATPSSSSSSTATAARPKRTLIESACGACRRRKSRCDGIRPACSRCIALKTDCAYQTEDGESRWSALKRKNTELSGKATELESERDELRELVSQLQARPEYEAQEILDRIRRCSQYHEVFDIVRDLRAGPLMVHASAAAKAGAQGIRAAGRGVIVGPHGSGIASAQNPSPIPQGMGLGAAAPSGPPAQHQPEENRLPPLRMVLAEGQLADGVESRDVRSASLGPTTQNPSRSQTPYNSLRSEHTV
ncbi:hypothetical protein K431DRAFT_4979 [Polychaeton citri CBS 116435]|uniref:Zn(2)-C6 fungal-type domain-containing protein n=1 Tax=Polychaeton citri CBS 116435 TaxID=1314669 RepID=A0A9P4UVJ7_9PEZI|nr:hypothetical protein K431DRAFT_4979 [Polychaeton citri CBS 116435]